MEHILIGIVVVAAFGALIWQAHLHRSTLLPLAAQSPAAQPAPPPAPVVINNHLNAPPAAAPAPAAVTAAPPPAAPPTDPLYYWSPDSLTGNQREYFEANKDYYVKAGITVPSVVALIKQMWSTNPDGTALANGWKLVGSTMPKA